MSLGLDHPLVCVTDLPAMRETYLSLGFKMRLRGCIRGGTSTALVIFRNQLLELVGIGDAGLLDGYPAGAFRFGRHVQHYLAERQGVPLTALNSSDSAADLAKITARGGVCAGRIEFGRDVITSDGRPDRTATTLQIFTRAGLERLSVFTCQQHRRDLIEFPEWMDHPNGATALPPPRFWPRGAINPPCGHGWRRSTARARLRPRGALASRPETANGA